MEYRGKGATYMKISVGASSIVSLMCFFLLAGCENLHVPNFFGYDEVPDSVKEQPRFVEVPSSPVEGEGWPRLGDVPFKPADFSSEESYGRSIQEMKDEQQPLAQKREEPFGRYPGQQQPIARKAQPLVAPQFVTE